MATAQTAQRERLEIIWRTATRDVQRFADESRMSGTNSKRWLRIDRGIEQLAGMLVDEIQDNIGPPPDHYSELDAVQQTIEDIWTYIETRLIDWAVEVETQRAKRRPVVAA